MHTKWKSKKKVRFDFNMEIVIQMLVSFIYFAGKEPLLNRRSFVIKHVNIKQ